MIHAINGPMLTMQGAGVKQPGSFQLGIVVNLDGKRDRKPSLDRLSELVADDLKAVNALIIRHMESPVAMIPQLEIGRAACRERV